MIQSSHLSAAGEELIAKFPTRFFLTAEGAMARSSIELSGSSRVFVMPSGVFTWTDGDGYWMHPEYGTTHTLDEFYEPSVDEFGDRDSEAPVHTEVADRLTFDDPFTDRNFGRWMFVDGDVVGSTTLDAAPPLAPWR